MRDESGPGFWGLGLAKVPDHVPPSSFLYVLIPEGLIRDLGPPATQERHRQKLPFDHARRISLPIEVGWGAHGYEAETNGRRTLVNGQAHHPRIGPIGLGIPPHPADEPHHEDPGPEGDGAVQRELHAGRMSTGPVLASGKMILAAGVLPRLAPTERPTGCAGLQPASPVGRATETAPCGQRAGGRAARVQSDPLDGKHSPTRNCNPIQRQ